MDKPLKILWHSNAPHVQTGYGNQTAIFTDLLAKDGHDVTVSAFYGLKGQRIKQANGVNVYPGSFDGYGNDILLLHVKRMEPDVTVGLIDIWVIAPEVLETSEMISWCPVDHEPLPPKVLSALRHCKSIWAMSRFGERMMRQQGLTNITYVPHGVDTEVFKPIDRTEARKALGLSPEQFIVCSVAANKGFPSRKNLHSMLKAWGAWIRAHPGIDAKFILHSNPLPVPELGGLDLNALCHFYGIPEQNIQFPDVYGDLMGMYNGATMNAMYNAADVFLLPSAGEGFGIPVVEAQAAGCPVIVADFSAQTELCGSGWLIPVDPMDDMVITYQYSEQAHVRPSLIIDALEQAYDKRGDGALRTAAREWAMQYDAKYVFETYMLPALTEYAALRRGRVTRRNQRLKQWDTYVKGLETDETDGC